MTKLNIEQLSDEWFELKKNRIGGSQIGMITGSSRFGTAYDLFKIMMGSKIIEDNPAMQQGRRLEPIIRDWFEKKTGKYFPPAVFTHEDFGISSLDGCAEDNSEIIEIKTCSEKAFNDAKKGIVEQSYLEQVHWGFLHVPQATIAFLIFYNNGEYAVVEVKPDVEYQQTLLDAAKDFHDNHLSTGIPPETTEKDYITIDDPEAVEVANRLAWALTDAAAAKKRADDAKKELLDFTDDGNCVIGPIRLTKSFNKKVDYKKACEDAEIDLDQYTTQVVRWVPRRIKT